MQTIPHVTGMTNHSVTLYGTGLYAAAGDRHSSGLCEAWANYITRPSITHMHETVSAAFNKATSGGVIAVSAYINGVLAENATSTASADRECLDPVPGMNAIG